MIRVLLVDDQHLIRAGLRMLCEAQPDIEVVGEADNGRDAISLAARLVPDVVVMDLRMPGVDGISATSRILADRPGTRVLVLTTFGDDDHLYPALTAGACGFLLKDAPPADLLDGVRRAAAGDSPFSQEVLSRLVHRAMHARTGTPPPVDGLTTRERQVLDLIAEGLSNAEIAERLHIGVTTVKTHITSLMSKTGSPNRVRLALFARGV
ncbi:DNA-binding response regulator, NarL/FixJ family, contains REC and HTH domains [Micromonospora phaseoli]|uniref:DNA-binding response regulator, NarL/FixJ family, contains REC and HTH domains n=1 Tax=Micromonospora phaseoli TaxID=1144548 RepID=A0A1H6Y472_9ACTN|nr:response regulator transcription factor [Micromonospora phaseoli]PZW00023.1 LuxR family two component transcriptional regulator [Micromonospora phaseoli]GIJ80437.1 DNA-binding response regulator [Micromonospora phaseoli]SEJ36098.1 DNA-binding response regulator, NarL/FixJ family, contains REC and HTH domains [Micromonospora phaseoli]